MIEAKSIGPVGLGVGRVVMDFQEKAVDPGGDGGTSQQRDEFRLASGDSVGG